MEHVTNSICKVPDHIIFYLMAKRVKMRPFRRKKRNLTVSHNEQAHGNNGEEIAFEKNPLLQ